MKFRLTTKLTMTYLILVLVVVFGFGGYYVSQNLEQIRRESVSTTLQFAERFMEQVDLRLKNMDQLVVDIFSDPEFRQAAQSLADGRNDRDGKRLREILNSSYCYKPDIRRAVVYDLEGHYYIGGVSDAAVEDVGARARWLMDSYESIFTQLNGKIFLPPQPDFWNSRERETYVISEIRPIKDTRTTQIIGFIEIQQNAMYLDNVKSIDLNGRKLETVVIMEETDSVFYASNTGADFEGREAELLELTKPYKQIIESDRYLIARASSNNFYCHTAVLLGKADLRAYQFSLVSGSLYIVLATALLTILFGVITTRRIMRPINEFVQKVGQVDLDNLKERITVDAGSKEVSVLEGAFNRMAARLHDSMARQKQHEEYQIRALFNALQKEMGPHFLYNSLGSIADLCESGQSEKASEACLDLTDLLRYASNYEMPDVTLADELENVKCYMSLMQNRYRQRLQFTCRADENAHPCMLPRLTLQPLLENAIKYSIQERDVVELHLGALYQDGQLVITVADNGCGVQEDRRQFIRDKVREFSTASPSESAQSGVRFGGIGLIGTLTRLEIYFGDSFRYEIRDNDYGGTTIELYMYQA